MSTAVLKMREALFCFSICFHGVESNISKWLAFSLSLIKDAGGALNVATYTGRKYPKGSDNFNDV
jgi:hypothetical protein